MSFTAAPQTPAVAGSSDRGRLWFVGALPPPLNGQSNCNRAMLGELTRRGATMFLHDIGGTTVSKVRGVLKAMGALLIGGRRRDHAYLSVPGNLGVWLFAPLAFMLRLRGIDHAIHHHSYRPINLGPSRAMRVLVAAGGRRQWHILLSTDMRRRFAALYLRDEEHRAMTLSNAYLFAPESNHAIRPERPITLGHMSVLTREKGVAYLLDLFAVLTARGHDWRLVIAGPCADPALAAALKAATEGYSSRIEYRGSLQGADKERFFADIDLFVLPTTLIDEAEPLVMLEAFGRGVDVVANNTGCIGDRVRTPDHLMTLDSEADATLIEARIEEGERDWARARRACVAHAQGIKANADAEAAACFSRLLVQGPHLPST